MLFRANAFSIRGATWRFCAFVAAAAHAHIERNEQRAAGTKIPTRSPRESVLRQKTNWSRSLTPPWFESRTLSAVTKQYFI